MSLLTNIVNSVSQAQLVVAPKIDAAAIYNDVQKVVAKYSVAANGGAVGIIEVPLLKTLPAGAIVYSMIVDITTPLFDDGNGASVSVGVLTSDDMVVESYISDAPWNIGALPFESDSSNFVKVTSDTSTVKVEVLDYDLFSGAFTITLLYVVSEVV